MAKLNLPSGEYVILESGNVVLTNRNLLTVKPSTFGGKRNIESCYPLRQIPVRDNAALVQVRKAPFEDFRVTISLKGGESIQLMETGRNAAVEWVKQINLLLTGVEQVPDSAVVEEGIAIPGADIIGSTVGMFKSAFDAATGKAGANTKGGGKEAASTDAKCKACHAPLRGSAGQTVQCGYCDTKQVI